MKTLKDLITNSFSAIDDELEKQRMRLRTIRNINWGMSVFLVVINVGLFFYNKAENTIGAFLHLIGTLMKKHC